MAGRGDPTFLKRQKEMKRVAKANAKRANRQARREENAAREENAEREKPAAEANSPSE